MQNLVRVGDQHLQTCQHSQCDHVMLTVFVISAAETTGLGSFLARTNAVIGCEALHGEEPDPTFCWMQEAGLKQTGS